jgi:hypothetical protein
VTTLILNKPGSAGTDGVSTLLPFGSSTFGGTTSPCFIDPWYLEGACSTTEQTIVVPAGTISGLRVFMLAIASNVTFTIRVNGADTALTVTITAGGTTAVDSTHSVVVNAGDQVSLKSVTSAADSSVAYPSAEVMLNTSQS